ncbi:hypothetical protein CXB51_005346 [Gossypium anomalum]|uniref:Uncharacterized protein n=1 Tax=Gossypium anomalum TaxID=47600 RepID=A0A8J6D9M3_9ROSI|nr:hypothetical protein CXB51_005346 [Gossypium anomalum]
MNKREKLQDELHNIEKQIRAISGMF